MNPRLVPFAAGVLLMVVAAIRFATQGDYVGVGIAALAAAVATVSALVNARG